MTDQADRHLKIVARYLEAISRLESWWSDADPATRSGFDIEWDDAMTRLDLLAEAYASGRLDEDQARELGRLALLWQAGKATVSRLGLDTPAPDSLIALTEAARRSSLARGA